MWLIWIFSKILENRSENTLTLKILREKKESLFSDKKQEFRLKTFHIKPHILPSFVQ